MGFGDDFLLGVEMHFVPPLRRCCFLVCLFFGVCNRFSQELLGDFKSGREKHPKFQAWNPTKLHGKRFRFSNKGEVNFIMVATPRIWLHPPKIHLSLFWMVFICSLYKLVSGKLGVFWYRLYPSCITWWYHQNEIMDFMISSWDDQKLLLEGGGVTLRVNPIIHKGSMSKRGNP